MKINDPRVQEIENNLKLFRKILLAKRKETTWVPKMGMSHNMTIHRFSKTKRKTLKALIKV